MERNQNGQIRPLLQPTLIFLYRPPYCLRSESWATDIPLNCSGREHAHTHVYFTVVGGKWWSLLKEIYWSATFQECSRNVKIVKERVWFVGGGRNNCWLFCSFATSMLLNIFKPKLVLFLCGYPFFSPVWEFCKRWWVWDMEGQFVHFRNKQINKQIHFLQSPHACRYFFGCYQHC